VTRFETRGLVLALFAAGCVVRSSLGTPIVATGGGAQPPDGEAMAGGPIEAGCSFNATQIRREMGDTVQVVCPANCGATGATWGTDIYTGDSAICRAAIHAGMISNDGGEVTVVLEPGRPAYRGTRRHGIDSSDYGNYGSSYRFAR
jgi:hypothetical protein